MPASNTTIQFLPDWRQEQSGMIERGGKLKIDYDIQRLPDATGCAQSSVEIVLRGKRRAFYGWAFAPVRRASGRLHPLNRSSCQQFHFTGDPQSPQRGLPSTPKQPRFIGLQTHTGQVLFRRIQWKAL